MQSAVKPFLLRLVLSLITVVVFSPDVYAWGGKGHRIVGYVAAMRVCDSTRDRLDIILDDESLSIAGFWADKIRGERRWESTRPWHYINVPDGVDPARAQRPPEGDVLSAIERQRLILEDEQISMRAQGEATRFLIHFVADVHQPLHVGRAEDLGGNKIRVRLGPDGKISNLHKYWDTGVLEYVSQPWDYAMSLLERAKPGLEGWQPGEPVDWARESAELRPLVYSFPPVDGRESALLDEVYQEQARQVVDQRLAMAGLRLAAELDSLYCSSAERRARREAGF